jgi:hypothetical protein
MKYAIGMGLDALIYTPSFIKINSGIQKLIGRVTHTHTAWRLHKPTLGKYAKSVHLLYSHVREWSMSAFPVKCA